MFKSELLEIIANGENSGVEFKRDDLHPEQLAKEVVALANFGGGMILLGVEDDGTVSGIQRANLEEWVMDTVFGRFVHPMILPFYQEVLFDDGKRVAVLTVGQGTSKPYVVRQKGREDIYIRVGSTSRLATREQQARLHAAGGLLHTELLPVSGTTLADLSLDRVTDYLLHVVGDTEVPDTDPHWHTRLQGMGFMTDADPRSVCCTVAGLVLFGRAPRRALPQAGLRLLGFASDDMTYAALEDTFLDGPLVAYHRRREDGTREMIEPGILESVIDRLRPLVSLDGTELVDGMRRDRRWQVPPEALREAIVNAFAHRDWTRLPEVEVISFLNRVEVTSPGALPNSMTVQKILAGQRSPRNTIIVEVLRDYGYVDARGMGVRRKIVPLVRAASGKDPEFVASDDQFRVVIPKA